MRKLLPTEPGGLGILERCKIAALPVADADKHICSAVIVMSCGLMYLMVFPGRGLISMRCCGTLHQLVSGYRLLIGLRMR